MSSNSSTGTRLSLISRVRTDDSTAWRELVELYGPLIHFWCRRQGLPPALASDCVQNVFLAILRSLDDYEPQRPGASFRGWLWTVTKHKIIDAVRQENRQAQAAGGSSALGRMYELSEANLMEDESTNQTQLKRLLLCAMNQVRDEFETKTWRAFERSVVDGLSTVAVAQELSLSTAAVRQYRSRVLRRLRQQLGDIV